MNEWDLRSLDHKHVVRYAAQPPRKEALLGSEVKWGSCKSAKPNFKRFDQGNSTCPTHR